MASEIVEKQRRALVEKTWDALISISPENVTYTLGFVIPSLRFLRRRLVAAIVTASGHDALVVVNMEYASAKQLSTAITDVRPYTEFEQEMVDVLIPTLQELGLSRGRIGIELDYIPTQDFERLRTALPGAEFINAEKLFLDLRTVKTAEEIEKLTKVSRASDLAHQRIEERARAGMQEIDLAATISETLYEWGILSMDTPTIVSGQRSSLANDGPTTKRLERGELVRIDILAYLDGYCSDVARTYVVGEPSPEQRRIFAVLSETMQALCTGLRPGVHSSHLYQVFAECFRAGGLPPSAFVGHGLGLSVHEDPWISKHERFCGVLQPGMVLCVEPYVNLPDGQGYQLENTLLVTGTGCQLLTDRSASDRLLQIRA